MTPGEWTLPVRFCGGVERESGVAVIMPDKKLLPKGKVLDLIIEGFLSKFFLSYGSYAIGGFLPHGGRIYRDRNFFSEFSTPEVFNEKSLVNYDLAAIQYLQNEFKDPRNNVQRRIDSGIVEQMLMHCVEILPLDKSTGLMVMTSSDMYDNNWGMHENYLIPIYVEPKVGDDYFFRFLASLCVFRQVISGSGGFFESSAAGGYQFVCSQRAEFHKEVYSQDYAKKPIVLNRQGQDLGEVLADGGRFTRIEILSDNSSLPSSLWLKVVFLSLALPAIVESFDSFKQVCLRDPLVSMFRVSRRIFDEDIILPRIDGKEFTLSWYLEKYLEIIGNYYAKKSWVHSGEKGWSDVSEILEKLSAAVKYIVNREFDALVGITDYITNKFVLDQYALKGRGIGRRRSMEFFYHVAHEDYSLSRAYLDRSAEFLGISADPASLKELMNSPYPESRAYERAMILKKFFDFGRSLEPGSELTMDWTSIKYMKNETNYTIVRRNPWDSNKELVDPFLDRSDSFEEYYRLAKNLIY